MSMELIRHARRPGMDVTARARNLIDWREWLGGFLIGVALCWPFLLPSITPLRWWMLLPCAFIAALLRSRRHPRSTLRMAPLSIFAAIFVVFVASAMVLNPLNEYGTEKAWQFAALAGAAYLAAFRQAPVTPTFARGLWVSLLASLALGVLVVLLKRDIYLNVSDYGVEELRQAVATTGMPLALALGACALITRRITPLWLFLSSIGLLGVAALEVLVRGRFDALVLIGLAVLVMLGPPWRHMAARIALFLVLLGGAAVAGLYALPALGQSYEYFAQLQRGGLAGRAPLFTDAWNGFLAHPFGQGFGAFEIADPFSRYPHNILLEAAFEMGLVGLVTLGLVFMLAFLQGMRLWLSPQHRVLGAVVLLVFLHTLKAGNLATFAFLWVLLYVLLVATPISAGWPLRRDN